MEGQKITVFGPLLWQFPNILNNFVQALRGGMGSQTSRGKNIKAALLPFSFLFLLCE